MKMSLTGVAPPLVFRDTEETIAELRREAASAVARQQRLLEENGAVRARAGEIEAQARRALAKGDELRARQILARGLCTLEARTLLEKELAESRRRVAGLLSTLVLTEDRAWGLRRVRST
jgi:phage shock protein A